MNLFAVKYVNVLSILILFITHSTIIPGLVVGELQPLLGTRREYKDAIELLLKGNNMRRRLAPFQVCLGCRCCTNALDPSTCTNMPCCFGIDCQLPNKPFGVCAFVPKTCNCTLCAT
ncbi:hypothetical protein LguiB_035533 [Lonicera macranthoides]